MYYNQIMSELNKVIYGKEEVMEKVILCLLANGHVLLEDIPGVGKTTLALAFSKVFDLNYRRMQFTSDVMPSDVTGFNMYDRINNKFTFKKGPIMCNMFLADEINRTSPKTQASLLEVMEEHKATIDGVEYKMEELFFVVATQNPYGSIGTNLLPQSQMDRFSMALSMGYPSKEAEFSVLNSRNKENPIDSMQSVVNVSELLTMRKEVDNVYVDDDIFNYIIDLTQKTRSHPDIIVGVSPRGSLAILKLAKAKAYISNRDYVIPSDVQHVFLDACMHRIVLKKRTLSCISLERKEPLQNILKSVDEPKIKKRG